MALPSMAGRVERRLGLSLTETENVVLSVMATGEDMLAIGSWEAPVQSLLAKGFVVRVHSGYYRITPAGEAAFNEAEDAELRGMIGERNAVVEQRETVDVQAVVEGEEPCRDQ
jgi:hypothetical protein